MAGTGWQHFQTHLLGRKSVVCVALVVCLPLSQDSAAHQTSSRDEGGSSRAKQERRLC